ncbi:MAG: hypothetical protein J2P57_13145 [Acidimicrobiaceae bacterium]|nr:hypothetical protein [Acidimicrobiaceae bacterium]
MEHHSALIVDELTEAHADRDAAFVNQAHNLGFTPQVAPNTTNRRSAIDRRIT